MIVHQVFAQIYQEEVKHVMVCEDYSMANYIARATYGPEAFAVDCLQYAVYEGCKYINGVFYEPDGVTRCKYIPTDHELATQALLKSESAVDTAMEFFELYVNKLKDPNYEMYFDRESKILMYYMRKYFELEENINIVPDVSNLRALVIELANE